MDGFNAPPSNEIQLRLLLPRLYAMLEEDVGSGDVTTNALVSSTQQAHARVTARQPGVIAGTALGAIFLRDLGLSVTKCLADGTRVTTNATVL